MKIEGPVKQCSYVWALSRSKPTCLWKDQFELVFHEILSKIYRFNCFMTKSLRNFFWGKIRILSKFLFNFSTEIVFFWTNMVGNASVTLQFEDLAVKNYLFLKDLCICWWHISNCSIKYFQSMWYIFLGRLLRVTVCKKGYFLPFSHTVTFSRQHTKKTSHWSKVLNQTVWDLSPTNAYVF